MKNTYVRAVCDACSGTGLYSGMCEKAGEPVVCLGCAGTGAATFTYTPFVKRKLIRGVKCVRVSRGNFIPFGVSGIPKTEMTYEEFLKKYNK